jgi:alpha-mannosidase
VKEGRWEVTASHWVETEKNIVSGEALCRHVLYTRATMARLFGLKPEDVVIDWAPDTFGHAATVPTYLRQGGLRYLYMHRRASSSSPSPRLSGGRARMDRESWCATTRIAATTALSSPHEILEALAAMHRSVGLEFAMLVYGVGDHGGGPTRRDLLAAREMAPGPSSPRLPSCPCRPSIEAGTGGRGLPVLRGELNSEFAGCYTTQSLIKRANRLAEARLADAEFAAVADRLATGAAYPADTLGGLAADPLLPLPRYPARLRRARHPHLHPRALSGDRRQHGGADDPRAAAAWRRRWTPLQSVAGIDPRRRSGALHDQRAGGGRGHPRR